MEKLRKRMSAAVIPAVQEVRLRSVLCFIVRRVPVWVVFVRNPGLSDGRGKWKAIVLFGRLLRQENMRHFAEVFQRGA